MTTIRGRWMRIILQRVQDSMAANPQAGSLAGRATLRGKTPAEKSEDALPVVSFQGCACVYRREAFLAMLWGPRHVPHAYGMEGVDVALYLMDAGWSHAALFVVAGVS